MSATARQSHRLPLSEVMESFHNVADSSRTSASLILYINVLRSSFVKLHSISDDISTTELSWTYKG